MGCSLRVPGKFDSVSAVAFLCTLALALHFGGGGPCSGAPLFWAARGYVVGDQPRAVCSADFNLDLVPDLAIANWSDDSVTILLGNGDWAGTFVTGQTLSAYYNPICIVSADFNGDLKPDLAVATEDPWDQDRWDVRVFRGLGDGTFHLRQAFQSGADTRSSSVSLAAADFDGDGDVDLAVANCGVTGGGTIVPSSVSVMLNRGWGVFYQHPDSPFSVLTEEHITSVTSGHFDGDQYVDLATTYDATHSVLVLHNDGTGGFPEDDEQPPPERESLPLPGAGRCVIAGQFNADVDALTDLAVANWADNGNVCVYLRDGEGWTRSDYSPAWSPEGIVAADFDVDGYLDLAVTDPTWQEVYFLVYDEDGIFDAEQMHAVNGGGGPYALAASDFNLDGVADFAVANAEADNVGVFTGTDLGFRAKNDYSVQHPIFVAKGQFNWGDGEGQDHFQDLAVAETLPYGGDIRILMGNGDCTFALQDETYGAPAPASITVNDFDNDGNEDVAVGRTPAQEGSISILRGNGDGTFVAWGGPYGWPGSRLLLATADFDRQDYPDLAWVTEGSSVYVALNRGAEQGQWGGFNDPVTVDAGGETYFVTSGSFNNDIYPDLAVLRAPDKLSIFLNDGKQDENPFDFVPRTDYDTRADPSCVITGQFNEGDDHIDLAVTNRGNNSVTVFLGDGQGGFSTSPLHTFGTADGPAFLAWGDFNVDGVPDLAVANQGTDDSGGGLITVHEGNGDGTFETSTGEGYVAAAPPNCIVAGAFGSDLEERYDLAVASGRDVGFVSIMSPAVEVSIPLSQGWNMISLPLEPISKTILIDRETQAEDPESVFYRAWLQGYDPRGNLFRAEPGFGWWTYNPGSDPCMSWYEIDVDPPPRVGPPPENCPYEDLPHPGPWWQGFTLYLPPPGGVTLTCKARPMPADPMMRFLDINRNREPGQELDWAWVLIGATARLPDPYIPDVTLWPLTSTVTDLMWGQASLGPPTVWWPTSVCPAGANDDARDRGYINLPLVWQGLGTSYMVSPPDGQPYCGAPADTRYLTPGHGYWLDVEDPLVWLKLHPDQWP